MIKSTSFDNSEIIKSILELHVPNHKIDCDPTYSKGIFYKNSGIEAPHFKFDLMPQTDDTIKADCRDLPLSDGSIDSIMFDPPFVISCGPSLKNPKPNSNLIQRRFSSFPNPTALYEFYKDSLVEFYRILSDNGVLIFKCQDTVSSSIQYMSHIYIHNMAIDCGFYPKDLFILNAKTRMTGRADVTQYHARKYHCYFWVFEKGNKKLDKIKKFNDIKTN